MTLVRCDVVAGNSFTLQIVSLAGLHSNAAATAELASAFKDDGMLAYVNLVQAKEKAIGCDVLTHQKWSGSEYIDGILSSESPSSRIICLADQGTDQWSWRMWVSNLEWVERDEEYGEGLDGE